MEKRKQRRIKTNPSFVTVTDWPSVRIHYFPKLFRPSLDCPQVSPQMHSQSVCAGAHTCSSVAFLSAAAIFTLLPSRVCVSRRLLCSWGLMPCWAQRTRAVSRDALTRGTSSRTSHTSPAMHRRPSAGSPRSGRRRRDGEYDRMLKGTYYTTRCVCVSD